MPVKTISVRLTFVTSVRVNQEMASNDFILSSRSDTEVSEIEDYELEVEGSPNSSFAASDEEYTHEAYADDPLARVVIFQAKKTVCIKGKILP